MTNQYFRAKASYRNLPEGPEVKFASIVQIGLSYKRHDGISDFCSFPEEDTPDQHRHSP